MSDPNQPYPGYPPQQPHYQQPNYQQYPQQPNYPQYPPPPYPQYPQAPPPNYYAYPHDPAQANAYEQQRLYDEGLRTAATLRESGISNAAIYDVLVKKGLTPVMAQVIINSGLTTVKSVRSVAQRDMLFGGLWLLGGIIITVGTYVAASGSGGFYFITYGPIIYGLIRFFKGVAKM
jgi:hypothetical protein